MPTPAPAQKSSAPAGEAPPLADSGEYPGTLSAVEETPASLEARALAHREQRQAGAAGRYTLQLMVACRADSVERLAKAPEAQQQLWFISYAHQGKPCYKVFWGEYGSIPDAEAARNDLPSAVIANLPKVPVVSMEKALR